MVVGKFNFILSPEKLQQRVVFPITEATSSSFPNNEMKFHVGSSCAKTLHPCFSAKVV